MAQNLDCAAASNHPATAAILVTNSVGSMPRDEQEAKLKVSMCAV